MLENGQQKTSISFNPKTIFLFVPSSTRAANSTGSADPSGSSEMDNALARRSRDFNLK